MHELVQIAYPELLPNQMEGRAIKELQQVLLSAWQTVIWELSQRPRNSLHDVVEVLQQYNRLQPGLRVQAVETTGVIELRSQFQEQAAILKKLLGSQTAITQ